MSNTFEIVRAVVGSRHKITKQQMIDILLALPIDLPHASTITGRFDDGRLYVGGKTIDDASMESDATARAWAELCKEITCISVLGTAYHDAGGEITNGLGVRYDEPGSMHPMQQAEITFAPAGMVGGYAYMRRHCRRLLIVE